MSVEVYRYELIIKTPTVITSMSGIRGLLYTTVANHIPGSIVRGGLFTSLILEGSIKSDVAHKEALSPIHSITPAVYISREGLRLYNEALFAHALNFRFKSEKEVHSIDLKKLVDNIKKGGTDINAFREGLLRTIIDSKRSLEENAVKVNDPLKRSLEVKSVEGEVINLKDGKWYVVTASKGAYIETSVERARGSSVPGVLYAYEYVEPGNRFTGYVSCLKESTLCQVLDTYVNSEIVIRLGRAIGRGYGLALLHLKKVSINLKDIEIGRGDLLVFEVIGPFFTLNRYGAKPPKPGLRLRLKTPWTNSSYIDVLILGIISNREPIEYIGWSFRTSTPKLPIHALSHGAIVVCKVEDARNPKEVLKLIPYIGIDRFSSQGYNILLPLNSNFIGE